MDRERFLVLNNGAFKSCDSLTEVTIPSSVPEIEAYAFGYRDYQFQVSKEWCETATKVEGFTVYGEAGSEAQRFAEENGFAFVQIS